ncbi:MAG: formylmethanofuran dehydrogenase [Firmicutes bacterium]|nr:formylmethanofuran dehydrogenase [Bacillota bacterium]
MKYNREMWEQAVRFHGHACPGLAQGFRVSRAALRLLGVKRAEDEELLAIVENDACGVDAVQALTGCTLGKGNLILDDRGKSVFIFARRDTGTAVRIYFHGGQKPPDPEFMRLRSLVEGGLASPEEVERFEAAKLSRIEGLLTDPEEDLLEWRWVEMELPVRAQLFNSFRCAVCGEKASESRARVRDGQVVCLSCAGSYSRGWQRGT